MNNSFLYFAYGSNMLTRRLAARCPSAHVVDTGFIKNFVLKFTKISSDGSGKATPIASPGKKLPGVIFRINANEIDLLDKAEGVGFGYDRKSIQVFDKSMKGLVTAETYFASSLDEKLKPYDWYRALVLAGSMQHNLSEAHQQYIRSTDALIDVDTNRNSRRKALAILSDSGFGELA